MPFITAAGLATAATVAGGVTAAATGINSLVSGSPTTAGGGGSTDTSSQSAPWSAQQPYLTAGFQDAANIYNTRNAAGPYTGQLYAPDNSTQLGGATALSNYASGTGTNLTNQTAGTAQTLQGAASPYVNNAAALASSGIPGANAATSSALANYGTTGTGLGGNTALSSALGSQATQSVGQLAAAQTGLANTATTAQQNQTGQTIANAQQYANSGQLNAAIAAAQQGTNDTLNETTVPGLNREASLGGNLNSSRAGMAEAMADRDAATVNANTAATMQESAYQSGLNLSAQQEQAGTNEATAANAALGSNALGTTQTGVNNSQYQTTSQIGALTNSLASGAQYQGLDANTQLAANAQLGNAASLGVNAATAANNDATTTFQQQEAAGGVVQADQQAQDAAAQQAWTNNNTYDQGILANYMTDIGGNYGQTSSGTNVQNTPANATGNLVGGATTIAGALSPYLGNPGTNLSGSYSTQAGGAAPAIYSNIPYNTTSV